MTDPTFGMDVLTRSLDGWEDAWLVGLEEPIQPVLRTYEEIGDGIIVPDRVSMPKVSYVVVSREEFHPGYEETLVYPAYASGQPRAIGEPEAIAGGAACTHVDALHDLDAGYTGLECNVDGDRCPYAIGRNQVMLDA